MRTGDPDRRSCRRLAWAGVATGMALFSAACGTRMSHEAVVAANRGGVAGASAGQPGAAGPSGSGATAPDAAGVLPGGRSNGPGGGVVAVPGASGSGSRTTSGSGGGSSTNGAAAQPTGEPLVIGSVGDYSGIAGASEKDGPKAL